MASEGSPGFQDLRPLFELIDDSANIGPAALRATMHTGQRELQTQAGTVGSVGTGGFFEVAQAVNRSILPANGRVIWKLAEDAASGSEAGSTTILPFPITQAPLRAPLLPGSIRPRLFRYVLEAALYRTRSVGAIVEFGASDSAAGRVTGAAARNGVVAVSHPAQYAGRWTFAYRFGGGAVVWGPDSGIDPTAVFVHARLEFDQRTRTLVGSINGKTLLTLTDAQLPVGSIGGGALGPSLAFASEVTVGAAGHFSGADALRYQIWPS